MESKKLKKLVTLVAYMAIISSLLPVESFGDTMTEFQFVAVRNVAAGPGIPAGPGFGGPGMVPVPPPPPRIAGGAQGNHFGGGQQHGRPQAGGCGHCSRQRKCNQGKRCGHRSRGCCRVRSRCFSVNRGCGGGGGGGGCERGGGRRGGGFRLSVNIRIGGGGGRGGCFGRRGRC